jgi:hypothetical protein
MYHFWKNLGTLQENVRNIQNVLSFPVFLIFSCSFPEVFPNFSENGTLWLEHSGHSEYTTLEHLSCIIPMRFEFYWLGKLGLLRWGHCKEHFE